MSINSETPITLTLNLDEEKALMSLLILAQANYKENRSMGMNQWVADAANTIFGMLDKHGYDYKHTLYPQFPLKNKNIQ